MSPLPQEQQHYDPVSFLYEWEEKYGELTSEQRGRFLGDPRLLEILIHHKYLVEASLKASKSFNDIIENINFKVNEYFDYVEITPEDLGIGKSLPWG
jgi:hypothetical protein